MATFRDLKTIIETLNEKQLDTEVCCFDEFGDHVFWFTGHKLGKDKKPILTGGTDFGQGFVRVGSGKFDLSDVRHIQNDLIVLKPYRPRTPKK